MKKIFFIFAILLGLGILMLLSFSKESTIQTLPVVDIDFSEWIKSFVWDQKQKTFIHSVEIWKKDNFYYQQISPIDGIYYISDLKNPFLQTKKDNVNIMTFGSGLFICNIQTGLELYEFHVDDLIIRPKGRGVFLIDTSSAQKHIFSFDTFLDVELVHPKIWSHIAQFTLFPSLLYKHDTNNTLWLKEADILRISIVDSIRYIDIKTKEDSKILFSWENVSQNAVFLSEVQKDIMARMSSLTKLHTEIFKKHNTSNISNSFFDASSDFLINGSKKEIFLKNTLIENILQMFKSQTITQSNVLAHTLAEMQELNPQVYKDGILLLKQYYYIAIYAHFIALDPLDENKLVFVSEWSESLFLSQVESIIQHTPPSQKRKFYTSISNLFSAYYFLDLDIIDLNKYFKKILQKMLDSKFLVKDDFLPFSFFVTQYLSTGPLIPNTDTIWIVSYLFQITNNYYNSNQSNKEKLASITTTIFYNYTRILTKLQSVFLTTFTDKTKNGLLIKEIYLDGDTLTLDPNLITAFIESLTMIRNDIEVKKNVLYLNKINQGNSQVIDSYSLLVKTLDSFNIFISMLDNYTKYLSDFHLDTENRLARGILIQKEDRMGIDIVQTYLQKFNNIDIATLQVINNFQKDGFYEIQVMILWNTFDFKLWTQNHMIADISYLDVFGTKKTFPDSTISLDQKEKQLQELFLTTNDANLKYKYDFKNFFENTFLKTSTLSVNSTPTNNAPIPTPSLMTPEMQLFIQHELLEKDFKNIADFLPIVFSNAYAYIKDGAKIVELSKINKVFSWEEKNYPIELSGNYIITRHLFSRMTFLVKREEGEWYEFNTTPIQIFPARIGFLDVPLLLKDIWFYIDTIKNNYTNQQSIIIDLTGKKVLLDNVEFIPIFPIK